MSVILDSWIETELGHVADSIQYGHTAKSSSENIGPHFLRITDIQDGGVDWSTVPYCCVDQRDIAKYSLIADDLVFARTGATVGKSFLIRGEIPESVFASYLIRVRLSTALAPQFTYYFFQSGDYWRQISDSSSGIGQPNVNGTKLAALRLPLPPLAEQRRIVAKIEELFSELDAGEESLRRARRQLGVYRQSLLKQAFEGKLTERWRKLNPEAHEWNYMPLESVVDFTNGFAFKSKEYNEDGVPVVRISDISVSGVSLDHCARIRECSAFDRFQLQQWDILIAMSGATTGKFGQLKSAQKCYQNQRVGCFRTKNENVLSQSFLLQLLEGLKRRIEKDAYGGAQPNISGKQINAYEIPVPCPSEQQEIVRLLDEQFTVIEQNEREIAAALKRSVALRQSILKKAFTGRLVAQAPSDEPACALLERIRAERAAIPSTPSRRTKARK